MRLRLLSRRALCGARSSGGEHHSEDEAVQGQRLAEDEHEDHSDDVLSLRVAADTSVADNADAEAGSQARETDDKAGTHAFVLPVVGHVAPLRGVVDVSASVGNLSHYAQESKANSKSS